MEHCMWPGMTCLRVSPILVYFAVGTLALAGEKNETWGKRIWQELVVFTPQLSHYPKCKSLVVCSAWLHLLVFCSVGGWGCFTLTATMTLWEEEERISKAELRLRCRIFSRMSEAECLRLCQIMLAIVSPAKERRPLCCCISQCGLCCALPPSRYWQKLLAQRLCTHGESSLNNHLLPISSSALFEVSPWQPFPKSSVGGKRGPMLRTLITHTGKHSTAQIWGRRLITERLKYSYCMFKGSASGVAAKTQQQWDTFLFLIINRQVVYIKLNAANDLLIYYMLIPIL